MRFQLRMVRWGARGACEQALVLGGGGLGFSLAVLVLLLVLASLLLRGVLPRLERAQDRRQQQELAGFSTLPPGTRSTPRDMAADRLEAAAAALGIGIAPAQAARRPRPGSEAAAAVDRVADAFVDPQRPLPWSAAARYVSWRTANSHQIDAVVAAALAGDPPRWQADTDHPGRPDLDLGGVRRLQRVLLSEAWIAVVEHEPTTTARLLEAAWRVNEQLLASPELAAHDTAIAVLEDLLAVLRVAPDPADGWEKRLPTVDPVAGARSAYLWEAWRLRRRAETALADRQRQIAFIVQPFARLAAMPQRAALVDAVARLDPGDVGAFDDGAFAADLDRLIPRWDALARDAMPTSWRSWPRSVHAALALDLTRCTLDVRRRWRSAGATTDQLPASWPEPLTGGRWTCRVADQQVVIGLAPDPFRDGVWPALEQVIALAPDAGAGR